jgi:hypothetical protein
MENTTALTQTIANVKALLNSRRNGQMNGQEVLEAYRALHPVTDEPLNIPFTDMYRALVALTLGFTPAVKFGIDRS